MESQHEFNKKFLLTVTLFMFLYRFYETSIKTSGEHTEDGSDGEDESVGENETNMKEIAEDVD